MMPAFSYAIVATSRPRYASWSTATLVTTATSGVTRLVASRRPPSPTSRTTTSTPPPRNASQASSVMTSKQVRSMVGPRWSRILATPATTAASVMGAPPITIRSRNDTKCGDV
jgi:hypothetical protein